MTEVRSRHAIVLLLFLATGCGNRLPPETDPNEARQALTAALDAWKDGRTIESLRDRTPPVDFRDLAWEKGGRLTRYQVKSEERSGVSVRFAVQLYLQQPDGTSRERVANYTVDAGRAIVIRPDF